MSISERQISTTVLVIGTGGSGLRAAIELAEAGVDVLALGKRPKSDAHTSLAAGGINAALATMDADDSWQQHAADTLKESYLLANPHTVEIVTKGAARGIDDLERYGMPFAREEDGRISQRFFGAHTYRRTAFAGDYTGLEIQRTLINRAAQLDVPILDTVYVTRILVNDEGRGVRRLRLRCRGRHPVPDPRRRGDPGCRRPQPHLAPHVVAARREHRRLVPPRRRGRRPAARPRARAVPPVRHHRARERGRHPHQRGGARRGRHPPQRARRAVHVAVRPRAHGALHPRPRRARRVHGDQGGPRHTERRGVARRLAPAPRDDHDPAAAGLPDHARTADARHHHQPDRDRADRALLDGRCVGAPRRPRHRRPRPVRDRRGVLRPARRQPSRRQLAHRAARVRTHRRTGGRGLRGVPARAASVGRSGRVSRATRSTRCSRPTAPRTSAPCSARSATP